LRLPQPSGGLCSGDRPRLSPAIRITNTPTSEFGPAISPDGKWVAYYANAKGRTDVMVKYLDSGATLNLTGSLKMELPTRAGQGGLAISPDGLSIAFGARPDPANAQYDTWTIPGPVGGTPRKLLASIPSVQWSPDGKLLTYTIAGSTQGDALGVSSSDGTSPRVVIPRQGGRHIHWPAWSRDGKYIYFIYTYDSWQSEPAETYRVAASGGTPEPVVRTVRRAIFPAPLPGGALLFAANPDSLELGLWWQPTAGSNAVAMTNGIGEHEEVRVTPDGKRVVGTLLDVRQSLITIPLTGSTAGWQQLTDGYTGDSMPSVDYRTGKMVFSSSRSGHRNLWISNEDGSNPVPLTTDASIDDNPVFSHDGQQIAFASDRDGQRGVWLTNAQGGAPKLLAHEFALDQLTWSLDDRQIIFAKPGPESPILVRLGVADGHMENFGPPGSVTPAWSPAEDVVAYVEATMIPAPPPSTERVVSRLFLKFVDGKGTPLYTELPRRPFTNPVTSWAPDGRRLALLSIPANGPAEIWIIEPKAPEPLKKLVELPPLVRPKGITWTKEGDRVIIANQEYNGDIVMYELNN
jgi:Tol biopolymer transport system component